nr:leucine-rich repeat domain-containing protein [Clostridia bacterium]
MKKTRLITIFIIIALLAVFITAFASCFNKSGGLKVTFYVEGQKYAEVKFNEGDYEIVLPENPVVEGKNFVRWEYERPETGEKAEFRKDTIWHYQSSMDVYAVFDENMSNFILNDNGDAIVGVKDKTQTEYVIPAQINGKNIEQIDREVFKDNKNITSVTIPNTMKFIEKSAFENCENLTTVNFAEDSEDLYLREYVFKDCTSLEEIVLPDGLSHMQNGVFEGCTSLTKLTTPFVGIGEPSASTSSDTYYTLRLLFGKDSTEAIPVKDLIITRQKNLFSVIFQYSVVENLTITSQDMVLPSAIGYYIRNTLKTVDFSQATATALNYSAFEGCTHLTSVKLPSNLEELSSRAFFGCTAIESIELPDSVRT